MNPKKKSLCTFRSCTLHILNPIKNIYFMFNKIIAETKTYNRIWESQNQSLQREVKTKKARKICDIWLHLFKSCFDAHNRIVNFIFIIYCWHYIYILFLTICEKLNQTQSEIHGPHLPYCNWKKGVNRYP